MSWISVEDKLPEINQMILTGCMSVAIFKGVGVNGELDWERNYYDPCCDLVVLHWMSLPEPPK